MALSRARQWLPAPRPSSWGSDGSPGLLHLGCSSILCWSLTLTHISVSGPFIQLSSVLYQDSN